MKISKQKNSKNEQKRVNQNETEDENLIISIHEKMVIENSRKRAKTAKTSRKRAS